MDCTAYDDLCHLQRDYAAYVADAERDEQIDRTTFLLGIFNGRAYTYTEFDGKLVIMIAPANPDGSRKVDRIGKFEVPDAMQPEIWESEDPIVKSGDVNHGG